MHDRVKSFHSLPETSRVTLRYKVQPEHESQLHVNL